MLVGFSGSQREGHIFDTIIEQIVYHNFLFFIFYLSIYPGYSRYNVQYNCGPVSPAIQHLTLMPFI